MLIWSIKIIVLSFLFIFLIHHLITFFKNTLTTPKVKDLVNIHNKKYEEMYDVLVHKNNIREKETESLSFLPSPSPSPNPNPLIPTTPTNMKDELKSFLKEQLENAKQINNDITTSTSIEFLDSNSGLGSSYL